MSKSAKREKLSRSAGKVASDNRRFVQFPHPGGEHSPDYGDWKGWNPARKSNGRENPHGRKFLEIGGAWLEDLDSAKTQEGKLWAWAEWEPESRVLRRFRPFGTRMPRYLWEPTLLPKHDYRGLHNTDPFIFGGFYYTDCKQQSFEGLRRLGRGSVIVFGSMKKPHWVVDTVLVVADYVDHTNLDYELLLAGRVPQCYWDTTLGLTCKGSELPIHRRWYRGATHDAPTDGMFSFFPCLPADKGTPFARPHIELPPEYFTLNLSQGAKGCALHAGSLAKSTVRELWTSIAEQIFEQGLLLGVWAESPDSAGSPSS